MAAGLVMIGGLVGIVGAIIEETKAFPLFAPFVAAPIIEEALKPAGVYLLLGRFQNLLRNQLYTAYLSALAGLSFAVVENIVYLYIYFPDHTSSLVIYRFTVNVFVHSLASFIFGFGINQKLVASIKGEIPFLTGSKKFFIAAILLHAFYNIGAFIAQISGFVKL